MGQHIQSEDLLRIFLLWSEDFVEINVANSVTSLIFQHLPRYLTPGFYFFLFFLGFYFLILLEFSLQLSITNISSADSNISWPPPFSMLGYFLAFL